MKILVLGSGLIGPASAYNAMSDPDVSGVTLCDIDQQKLDAAQAKLSVLAGGEKLTTLRIDARDQAATAKLMAEHDAVVGALDRPAIGLGIRAAVEAQTPLVDLLWPLEGEARGLKQLVDKSDSLVIVGCGVEPGLTEIMARYLAEKLDRIDELHIKCGGIPEKPAPPLGYKIVFGGKRMPLWEGDAHIVENGELKAVPRYSGAHAVHFPGVGEVEAWNEEFFPWLMDLEVLQGLKKGTQMTVRWPGYAEKASVLWELDLVSTKPIDVDGVQVAPKDLLDALLYPHVKMEEGDRDITCFRVEAIGEKKGQPCRYKIETVDRYDEALGFTSMARTTGFAGAIVARMAARGEIKAAGMLNPEQVITGPLFDRLVADLAVMDIRFDLTTDKTKPLQ
jgi:saccharopine dehydrogenase-like NADP-dependent oxidoreductase